MDTNWITGYLGLGSNLTNELGSPKQHIKQAVFNLQNHEQIRVVRCSSLYLSKPMGPQNQPDFINAVVALQTTLSPFELLDFCQSLEQKAKRQRLRHWGERSLDVDILLYGDEYIRHSRLNVPHIGISDRNFVLVPLAELAPDLIIHDMLNGQMIKRCIQDYPNSQNHSDLQKLTDANKSLTNAN